MSITKAEFAQINLDAKKEDAAKSLRIIASRMRFYGHKMYAMADKPMTPALLMEAINEAENLMRNLNLSNIARHAVDLQEAIVELTHASDTE